MKKTMAEHKVKLLLSSLVILLPAALGWQILWPCLGLLAVHWVCLVLVFADHRNRQGQSKKAVGLIFWLMPVVSLLMAAIRMAVQQGAAGIRITYLITCFAFGLLFLVVGNYMPKIRQNHTMGIRVKWTLASEANWNATHRFAGKVWVAAGLLCMISALLPLEMMMVVFIASIVLASVVPCVYSYRYYKQHPQDGKVGKIYVSPAQKMAARLILVGALAFAAVAMVAGSAKVVFGEDSLTVDASLWQDMTISYDSIESVSYVTGDEMPAAGIRTYGLGNLRMLMGSFSNDAYGNYTRYTYDSCDDCVVLSVSGMTVVLNGPSADDTREIYQELTARLNSSAKES